MTLHHKVKAARKAYYYQLPHRRCHTHLIDKVLKICAQKLLKV
jgi:hypothetical protein